MNRAYLVLAVSFTAIGCTGPAAPPAPRCASGSCRWAAATAFLDSAVADHAAPGAVLGISDHGHRFYYATGQLGVHDPARPDSTTVYDLASMTKVVGLTTVAMMAVDEGRLDLDAPVQRYLPEFAGPNKQLVTIRHLLTHSSGLPAWRPLYTETTTRQAALALADTTPLDTLPGVRMVYSDLGAMVLTQVIERIYGERIDSLVQQRIAGPLGLTSTRYLPPASWLPRIAPTENDPWRGHEIRGEVHDENASRLGGVSGHAGLFSDAVDLLTFAQWELSAFDSTGSGWPIAPPRLAHDVRPATGPAAGLQPRAGLGHPVGREQRRYDPVPPQLRPHRLHRHLDLDRPHPPARHRAAEQPGQPHPQEPEMGPRAAGRRRPRSGGRRPAVAVVAPGTHRHPGTFSLAAGYVDPLRPSL